ncbi:MAG: hypothetical protein Q8O74_03905 [bacterium]|nr:hypothetical protein [bacterium]
MKLSLLSPYLLDAGLKPRQIAEYNRQIRQGTAYAERLTAQERALLVRLLSDEEQAPGAAHVITEKVQNEDKPETLPSLLFGVLAPDWAGLADACLGTVHEAGLNIAYTHGFILRRERQKLGVILMEVEVSPNLTKQSLDRARGKVQERLARIAADDEAKKTLQRQESRRLYAFTAVTDALKKQVNEQDLKEIMGDNGEAIKFFVARQESYINQRPLEAIARQVLANFRLKTRIRQGLSSTEMDIGPIPFGYKDLTALTIITKENWLTYELLLRIIDQELPGYRRYDDYAYFTADKLSVYHLEITGPDDKPLSPQAAKDLEARIKSPPTSREALGPTPGVELIRRKIVPPMLDEERELKIPQGYIHPHAPDNFKLIAVASGTDAGQGLNLVSALSAVPGLSAAMPDKPSHLSHSQNGVEVLQEISIIDIWIDRKTLFPSGGLFNEEEVYTKIEQAVRNIPGFGPRLRIFDRTSRVLRQMRLAAVVELAKVESIPAQEIKSLFYNLGDKCLLNPEIPDSAVFSQLKLWQQIQKPEPGFKNLSYRLQNLQMTSDQDQYTALAVALPSGSDLLARVMALAGGYQVLSLCRSDLSRISLLLFSLTCHDLPLSEKEQAALSAKLDALSA